MRKNKVVTLVIILLFFAISIYFYPKMPDKMASHWNYKGQVDGYLPKSWSLFLMPIVSVGLFLLFILIPKIDPLKENIEKFRKYFDGFIVFMMAFLFYIYLLTIFWNIGIRFNMAQFVLPAMGILFYYCGLLLENVKKNWFIGIKTPWTLSNESVWDKTHRIAGKLFKVTGIIAFLGILFPNYGWFLILVPAILVPLYLVAYSYFEYQAVNRNGSGF